MMFFCLCGYCGCYGGVVCVEGEIEEDEIVGEVDGCCYCGDGLI